MIISHQKKFVYIRTVKTGSSSLEIFLSQFCSKKDIITPLFSNEEKFKRENNLPCAQNYKLKKKSFGIKNFLNFNFYNTVNLHDHKPIDKVFKTEIGKNIKDYFFFSFIRNPFDWIISFFYWDLVLKNYKIENLENINDIFSKFLDEKCDFFFKWQRDIISSRYYKINIFKFEEMEIIIKKIKEKLNLNDEVIQLENIRFKDLKLKKKIILGKKEKEKIIKCGNFFFKNFYNDLI